LRAMSMVFHRPFFGAKGDNLIIGHL
jgi:hypothetical protein